MKSGLQSPAFDKFSQIAGQIMNPDVEDWKKQGGRVIGYTCSFVPEELFIAAGILPFRIRGTGSRSADRAADYFVSANICSFVRHCFNQVLSHEYSFLDGAVIGGGCDAGRHLLDNWRHSPAAIPFLSTVFFPSSSGIAMAVHYRKQLAELKSQMEKHFAVQISDQNLQDAICLCNETRELQKELYALRKDANPSISGSETVAVMVAGSSMPKTVYNTVLKQLLSELHGTIVPEKKTKARLMIVGPGHDETMLCDIVESLGGLVATDLTCFGGKMLFGAVQEDGPDPLQSIADYQVLQRPFCPKNIASHPAISREVFAQIRECRVDGIIGQNFLCCNHWGGELFILNKEMQDAGIPMLRIEREYLSDSRGQLQTRIQAFLEIITGGDVS